MTTLKSGSGRLHRSYDPMKSYALSVSFFGDGPEPGTGCVDDRSCEPQGRQTAEFARSPDEIVRSAGRKACLRRRSHALLQECSASPPLDTRLIMQSARARRGDHNSVTPMDGRNCAVNGKRESVTQQGNKNIA